MKCEKCGHESESLVELADRKGWDSKAYHSPSGWHCEIWREMAGDIETAIIEPRYKKITGKTYAEAEDKARGYLKGLRDVKGIE